MKISKVLAGFICKFISIMASALGQLVSQLRHGQGGARRGRGWSLVSTSSLLCLGPALCVCFSLSLLSLVSVCECHSVCCVPFKKFSFILSLLVFSSRPALSPYLGLSFVSIFALRQCDWFTFYISTHFASSCCCSSPSPSAGFYYNASIYFVPFFFFCGTTSVAFLLFHNLLVSLNTRFLFSLIRSSLHSLPPKSCQPLVL